MKLRILAVTEATYLNTGYAVYFKELLTKLKSNPNYEIAEFACYAEPGDARIYNVPWTLYCNLPNKNNPEEVQNYNPDQFPLNPFGQWKFESVCLEFKPHIVISIRDYWMDSYIDSSPFRRLFKWVWMPTVDAFPQHEQWVEMYSRVDAVLTYNDWSGYVLQHQSNGKIKWMGSAPPIANSEYKPYDKKELKKQLGFSDNTKIIGTVMRNQRRKLYPDLFDSFRKYLDLSKDNDTYLYCHTSYPDGGWDFPYYIKYYNICNKTLFTYVCDSNPPANGCGNVFPSFFNDAVTFCTRCGNPTAVMSNVHIGASPTELAKIYNMFDLYVQYANSEGFGVPLAEAAACAVPIMAIDYSAMSDVLRKLKGIALKPIALSPEIETGCMRAIPNNEDTAKKFLKFFKLTEQQRYNIGRNTYELSKKVYSIDNTVEHWEKCFKFVQPKDLWNSPPRIHHAEENIPNNLNNKDLMQWLIINVLGEPERLNSYMELRMTKDLNFGVVTGNINGTYFNDGSQVSSKSRLQKFDVNTAYQYMRELCEKRNFWEKRRCGIQ